MNTRDNEATQLQGGRDEATQLHNEKNETTEHPEKNEIKGKAKNVKKVAGFSGVGVLLGSAASFYSNLQAANSGTQDQQQETEDPTDTEQSVILPEANIQEAVDISDNIVNDEMTFEEAFATAREALGTGSAFEWRGNVYATYTKEEWVDLTDEEKSDFYDGLNMENPYDSSDERNEVRVEISEIQPNEEAEASNTGNSMTETSVSIGAEAAVTDEEDTEGFDIVGSQEVEEEVQVLFEEDGPEGTNPDGDDVYVIDVDGDMTYDVLWTDSNHDGIIDEDELIDIHDAGLTVNELEGMMDSTEDMAANTDNTDMPDYFSDALNDDIIV